MTFLDTSAIYALADRDDANHARARELFDAANAAGERWLTHNYVLLESVALLQHRLGLASALSLADDADGFEIEWIDAGIHREAIESLRSARRRHVSLVDAASFVVMRRRRVTTAFAFDPHFSREGFRLLA